jgi:OOP family OmpA-OmpF porin
MRNLTQKAAICSLATTLGISSAYAQDPVPVDESAGSEVAAEAPTEPIHYVGVLGTVTRPDDGRNNRGADIDYAMGVSALFGKQYANRWGYEIQGFGETFETGDVLRTDWYRYGLNADLTYSWGDRSHFTPFVLAGVGGNYDDVFPGEDKTTWFANVGAGFVTGGIESLGGLRLRSEVRYIYDDFEDGYGDIRLGVGFELPLFATAPEAAMPAPAAEEQVKIVEVPTGLLDSDGDGVIDEKDQCPDTPAGTRVDGNGCPLPKVMTLNGVTFEFDKTRLRPDAETILDSATEILKKYPDMQVEVAGHTDSMGTEAYNLKLSDGRAAAVREYFISKGVPETQLTSKGYGEAEPVADNATEDGREHNRRVELRILN